MKINLKKLPASLRAQTEEIADRLGVSVCDDGYPLLAEEGEELKVDFDGKTVCITYPARNQFFRGLRLFKQHFRYGNGARSTNSELCSIVREMPSAPSLTSKRSFKIWL